MQTQRQERDRGLRIFISATVLNHNEGVLGLPLNVLLGWYSKPEWIQFIILYAYTIGIFAFMQLYSKSKRGLMS